MEPGLGFKVPLIPFHPRGPPAHSSVAHHRQATGVVVIPVAEPTEPVLS
jgi:hypothetical protein